MRQCQQVHNEELQQMCIWQHGTWQLVCGLAERWPCMLWVLEWCQVTVDDLTVMPRQQQSVCGSTAHVPTPTQRHRGLLMVHSVLKYRLWMCGSPAYKPTPKALALKFSQKLWAYMLVYMVCGILLETRPPKPVMIAS